MEKLHHFLENCVKYISIVPLLLLTVLVTIFQNTISFDIIETSVIERNGLNFFLLLAASLVLLAGVYYLLRKIPETALFVVLALVYLAGGIYLITHIQMELRYDSGICYWNALDFFGEKVITTWCEPTYQSIWSGPLISMNCKTKEPWLTNLYSGGSVFWLLASVMNVLTVMLFGFSLVFILWKTFRMKLALYPLELFCLLFLIGGFLFHLFWETKSQYVYPYVVLMVPIAAKGINVFFEGIRKYIKMKGSLKNDTVNE